MNSAPISNSFFKPKQEMKTLEHWSKRALASSAILAALLCLLAAQTSTPPADWPKVLRLGYVPVQGKSEQVDVYLLVGQHLARELNLEVKMVAKPSYLEVISELRNRAVEAANLGPYAYVEAAELAGVEAVVMELDPQGRRGYQSIIITRADAEIRSVEDARGKVLAFSDPKSTSGFLVPMLHFLQDLKTPPAVFASRVVFAGSHGAVARGVFDRRFALGATGDLDFFRALEEMNLNEKDFRVLWRSRLIPGTPYCLRKDLPQSFKTAFREAMVNMKDPETLARLKIGGFSPATDSEYNIIRELRNIKQ